MDKNKIIDCHTHLQTQQLIDEYFKKRKGYAIAIQALDSLIGNGMQYFEEVKNYDNVFCVLAIDGLKDIAEQLKFIEEKMKTHKVIGLKFYLGYQPILASDEKFYPIYRFAQKHNLTVVYHTGDASSTFNCGANYIYSSCLSIERPAKDFPDINFIISHFDEPHYDDVRRLVLSYQNVYTDISGYLETYFVNKNAIKDMIKDLKPYAKKYPDLYKKVMFGTDYFGLNTHFYCVEEYQYTLKKIFGTKHVDDLFYNNCMHAYPLLKKYIK